MKVKPITQAQARAALTAIGCTFKRTEAGDFRVTIKGMKQPRAEAIAYYTNSIVDAIQTGAAMVESEAAACMNRKGDGHAEY